MQWLMLQQDKPDDYVIASGEQYSVRQFIEAAAAELGITLSWEGEETDEVGVVAAVRGDLAQSVDVGQTVVRVDSRYFRPTEVDSLLGDATKARERLGWQPKTGFEDLVAEMMREDYRAAQRDSMVKRHGYRVAEYQE
jgi:GDPmannose 4,6-dehydratase